MSVLFFVPFVTCSIFLGQTVVLQSARFFLRNTYAQWTLENRRFLHPSFTNDVSRTMPTDGVWFHEFKSLFATCRKTCRNVGLFARPMTHSMLVRFIPIRFGKSRLGRRKLWSFGIMLNNGFGNPLWKMKRFKTELLASPGCRQRCCFLGSVIRVNVGMVLLFGFCFVFNHGFYKA